MITGIDFDSLAKLRKSGLFSDVTVTVPSANNAEFKLHKVILASASKFFEEQLTKAPALDKIIAPIPVTPDSNKYANPSQVYSAVFDAMYGPKQTRDLINEGLSSDNCFTYYSVADSLQVDGLKKAISEYILSSIVNPSNITSVMVESTKLQIPHLIDKCQNLMMQDLNRCVLNRDQLDKLLQLPFEAFLKLIQEDSMVVDSEDTVFDMVIKYIEMRESKLTRSEPLKPNGAQSIEIPPTDQQPKIANPNPEEAPPPVESPKPNQPSVDPPVPPILPPIEAPKSPTNKENAPSPPIDIQNSVPIVPPTDNIPMDSIADLAKQADQRMQVVQLTDDQKKQLLLALRYKYISHEKIMKESKNPIIEKFRDVLLEGLSAKLGNYEPGQQNYQINVRPRLKYTSTLNLASAFGQFANQQGPPQFSVDPAGRQLGNQRNPATQQNKNAKPGPAGIIGNAILNKIGHSGGRTQGQVFSIDKPVGVNSASPGFSGVTQNSGTPQSGMRAEENLPIMRTGPNGNPYMSGRTYNGQARQGGDQMMRTAEGLPLIRGHGVKGSAENNPQSRGMGGQDKVSIMRLSPEGMPIMAGGTDSSTIPLMYSSASFGYNQSGPQNGSAYNIQNQGQQGQNPHGSLETNGSNAFFEAEKRFNQGLTQSMEMPMIHTMDGTNLPLVASQHYGAHHSDEGDLLFTYRHDFDENGALYYLGTAGGQAEYTNPYSLSLVKVFFSSMGKGNYEDLVGRSLVNCRTLNAVNSFMGIDFGIDRFLIPSCYTIRNRDSSKHIMLNWMFEGSVDGHTWYILDKRIHKTDDPAYNKIMERERQMIERRGATSTWSIDQNYLKIASRNLAMTQREFSGFRCFRVKQISKNSSGADNLALSGLELYGVAKGQGWNLF